MEPITRKELFMAKAAGENVNVPEPITREEKYLKYMADNSVSKYFGESTEVLFDRRVEYGTKILTISGTAIISGGNQTDGFAFNHTDIDTIIVIWDGVEYYTTQVNHTDGNYYIGNMALTPAGGNTNGLPFCFVCYPDLLSGAIYSSYGTHSYEVYTAYGEQTIIADSLDVVNGDGVKVTWDGVAYNCAVSEMEGLAVFGNNAVFGGEDTGEPFFVGVQAGAGVVLIASDMKYGFHTIRIEKSVIHTIDPKFLPGGGGGDSRFVVNVTRDEEWKPSFDKTYEEIMEACLAGKEVVLRDGSFVYTLSNFDPDEGYCAFFLPGNQVENIIGFSIMRIKRGGLWEECGGTVNCTIDWSDTNEPSQSTT